MEENFFDDIGGEGVTEDFEDRRYECFGVRFRDDDVLFTLNNKVVLSVSRDDFPGDFDFNSGSSVSELVGMVRTKGLAYVVDKYALPAEVR